MRQHYNTDALDASLLLMAIVGFLPGDDQRLKEDGTGDCRRAHRAWARVSIPR
jgi:hypothetical protein